MNDVIGCSGRRLLLANRQRLIRNKVCHDLDHRIGANGVIVDIIDIDLDGRWVALAQDDRSGVNALVENDRRYGA